MQAWSNQEGGAEGVTVFGQPKTKQEGNGPIDFGRQGLRSYELYAHWNNLAIEGNFIPGY